MINIVEKVIKLCDRICDGNYPITTLRVFNYDKEFTINELTIAATDGKLGIYSNRGTICIDITEVERAKLLIAFDKLVSFSRQSAEDLLDEYVNVENVKISNVNDLDCNN